MMPIPFCESLVPWPRLNSAAESNCKRRNHAIYLAGTLAANNPAGSDGEQNGENHADDGREKNKEYGLDPAGQDEGLETGMSDGGSAVAAHEGVRGTGGQAQNEGDEIPGDGAEQAGEKDLLGDQFDVNHALADGGGHGSAEDESGDEIPESSPGDGTEAA